MFEIADKVTTDRLLEIGYPALQGEKKTELRFWKYYAEVEHWVMVNADALCFMVWYLLRWRNRDRCLLPGRKALPAVERYRKDFDRKLRKIDREWRRIERNIDRNLRACNRVQVLPNLAMR